MLTPFLTTHIFNYLHLLTQSCVETYEHGGHSSARGLGLEHLELQLGGRVEGVGGEAGGGQVEAALVQLLVPGPARGQADLGPGLADALPISILYVKLGLLTVVVVVCRWGKCFCCCGCRSNVAKH